jgi:predicted ArsR family transcriptional regulator
MSKRTQQDAGWNEDVARKGIAVTIAERLKFHGGLHLGWTARYCGCCVATARKHLDRLVETGQATKEFQGNDWHYRPVTT